MTPEERAGLIARLDTYNDQLAEATTQLDYGSLDEQQTLRPSMRTGRGSRNWSRRRHTTSAAGRSTILLSPTPAGDSHSG